MAMFRGYEPVNALRLDFVVPIAGLMLMNFELGTTNSRSIMGEAAKIWSRIYGGS